MRLLVLILVLIAAAGNSVAATEREALLETREELRRAQRELVKASRNMERLRLQRAVSGDPSSGAELSDEQLAQTRTALREAQRQLEAVTRELRKLNQNLPEAQVQTRILRIGGDPRPMVGILMEPADASSSSGVRLRGVTPGAPAERAGLRSGDEITAVDGQAVDGPDGVATVFGILEGMKAGDTFVFTYQRNGQTDEVEVIAETIQPEIDLDLNFNSPRVLVERFGDSQRPGQSFSPDQLRDWADRFRDLQFDFDQLDQSGGLAWRFAVGWSGLELVELNPELGRYFGTDSGALVVATSDSIDADLQPGDVIVAIDGTAVRSPKQAMRVLGRLDQDQSVSATILRDGGELELELTPPEERGFGFLFKYHTEE